MKSSAQITPYELIVPGDLKSLSLIRMVVKEVGLKIGIHPDYIDKIEVAVDEACTNVIEHGYDGMEPHPPVEIHMNCDGRQFVVDIVDSGPAFNFDRSVRHEFPDHWLNTDQTRGAGLYLMFCMMDDIDYQRLPDLRNRMRLVKKIDV
ncbi:MAG: ATP-binding protein [Spartobacteria bacterium]|nr:ATP-binding protein [Spartobacteria bacterium]